MLFDKLKNKLSFKNKHVIYLVAVLLIFLLLGAIFTFYNMKSQQSAHIFTTNKGEWIVVTVSNSQNKSDLWLKEISAVRLDSISFSESGNSIILGGKGLLKDETGFYKLDLKDNKVTALVTEGQLKETNKIAELSQPYIAGLSSNEQDIYFTAIPAGTKPKDFFGIKTYPNELYRYTLKEKQISELFKVPDTFIPSISFTYQ